MQYLWARGARGRDRARGRARRADGDRRHCARARWWHRPLRPGRRRGRRGGWRGWWRSLGCLRSRRWRRRRRFCPGGLRPRSGWWRWLGRLRSRRWRRRRRSLRGLRPWSGWRRRLRCRRRSPDGVPGAELAWSHLGVAAAAFLIRHVKCLPTTLTPVGRRQRPTPHGVRAHRSGPIGLQTVRSRQSYVRGTRRGALHSTFRLSCRDYGSARQCTLRRTASAK